MNDEPVTADSIGADVRSADSVVRRSGTSFYWAMRFLPEPQRSAMFAIYAFCRAVDDIADGPGSPQRKREVLSGYRRQVQALYRAGTSSPPDVADLAPALERYRLPEADFLAVIDGMETDAAEAVRIADEAELALYIDRVAGAVGRLSCRVFGLPDGIRRPLADTLGIAFQLTNILRDLREDAARDRLYLPRTTLRAFGLGALEPVDVLASARLGDVCLPLAHRAQENYAAADRLMDDCDPRAVKPARMMRAAYGRLFDKVLSAGFSPLPADRVSLGRHEKLAVAIRHGIF